MDTERIDKLIAYAMAMAACQDPPRPELGQIHLIKYAYLADLEYAARHQGQTFSRTEWKFHHFGPWSTEAWKRIDPVIAKIGARTRSVASQRGDEYLRYMLNYDCESLISQLDRELPWEVTRSVRNAVRKFGNDTQSLLHYVYQTPPMLKAAPGELLSFSDPGLVLTETEPASVEKKIELSRKQEKKQEAAINDLKARIQASLASNKALSAPTAEYYEPRYDDTFTLGQQWLDEMACGQIPSSEGTLTVDDSLWKSPSRHDPDLS
jgi:hypothetical protein